MKSKILFVVLLLGFVVSCGKEVVKRPDIAFQEISSQGLNHFVYIEKSEINKTNGNKPYLEIVKYICDKKASVCVVLFWDDKANVPFSFPMTDLQVNAQVAQYNLNKNTGLNRLKTF